MVTPSTYWRVGAIISLTPGHGPAGAAADDLLEKIVWKKNKPLNQSEP